MNRSFFRALSLAGFSVSIALHALPASGEPRDAAALELAQKAIYTDYLATKFADAEKKLKQAIALCRDAACSSKVKAQLHRDLGVVYVGGMNRAEEGKTQFVQALTIDPATALDADLASPEIEAAFGEAKKTASAEAQAPEPTPSPTSTPSPAAAAAQGDLVHTPPPEQAVVTPLPIYATLPEGVVATKVLVSYKPFGTNAWKSIEMTRVEEGFGVEIPCLDIGSTTGAFKYYIQAFDAENNLVSWSGTRSQPRTVPIRTTLTGEPAHLPGQPPPAKCLDTGDCPPDFPGCRSPSGDNRSCEDGGNCTTEPSASSGVAKNWVSLALQQDVLFLSSATNTCSGGTGYDCFSEAGEYYANIPYDKSGGALSGGPGVATTRILVGYDRVLGSFTVGARLGFAFGGGPTAPGGKGFFPLHAEARASYWFGRDPFGSSGPRPYITVGGGVAQVDSSVNVIVYENEQAYLADKRLQLDAWKKSGTGFLALGGGLLYAITPSTGPLAEVRVIQLLGASGTGMALQLGYALGF